MHKRIALVGTTALLLALLVGLPGTSLRADEQPLAPQSQPEQGQSESTALEEAVAPGSESFLEALAGKLGITVERLEQALKETKKELIEAWVDEWAKKMKEWVDERAKEMKERLAQVEPQRLLLLKKGVGQELKERLQRRLQAQVEKKLVSPTPQRPRLPSYAPPYYWPWPGPAPCSCTCYCCPNYYYMPIPLQPEQLWPQPWFWFQFPLPEVMPQPEEKGK